MWGLIWAAINCSTNFDKTTALISKLNITTLYLYLAWPNYGFDVLNITMHTEVAMHSMNAYVWCRSKVYGSLHEIPSVTMGDCISKIFNEF